MVLSKTQFTRDRSLTKVLMSYIGSKIRPPGMNSCRVQKISEVCLVALPVETCCSRKPNTDVSILWTCVTRGAHDLGRSANDICCWICVLRLGVVYILHPNTRATSHTDSPASSRPKTRSRSPRETRRSESIFCICLIAAMLDSTTKNVIVKTMQAHCLHVYYASAEANSVKMYTL